MGVPTSIRMACGTPLFGARVTSMTVSGCDPAFGKLAFLALPGRTWSLQGPILDPRGVPKMFQNRHGEARSAPLGAKVGQKALPKGSQNGVGKVIEKGIQNESFMDA